MLWIFQIVCIKTFSWFTLLARRHVGVLVTLTLLVCCGWLRQEILLFFNEEVITRTLQICQFYKEYAPFLMTFCHQKGLESCCNPRLFLLFTPFLPPVRSVFYLFCVTSLYHLRILPTFTTRKK